MIPQKLAGTFNTITPETETHLLTSLSLQVDFIYILF